MNKKEFAIWASALKTYYPKEKILPNAQALELWYKQLQNIPYDIAEITLNEWVAKNVFSPSIAEILQNAEGVKVREKLQKLEDKALEGIGRHNLIEKGG